MSKPETIVGYEDDQTEACERVLVTLLRKLGPWRESIFLVGGLTPRYLVRARPPDVPPHAGTLDVDIVVHFQILTETEAYRTLERNLKEIGFERAPGPDGGQVSWRWQVRTERDELVVLELLADAPEAAAGVAQPIPTDGAISAIQIPHASIVFDLHDTTEIRAELLGRDGIVSERVRYADLVSFTCLKAFAFDHRHERKDAHDLIYCIENAPDGRDGISDRFRNALGGVHGEVVRKALGILAKHFATDAQTDGYLKDGPVAVAKFEHEEEDNQELRTVRQREASDTIEGLLAGINMDPI